MKIMRPSLIGLIVLSVVFSETGTINATITVIPSVAAALINDSTFFNCSTTSANVDWLFGYRKLYTKSVIYSNGTVKLTYAHRFRVENYTSSFGNHFNLMFLYVTEIDAGPFLCLDPGNQEQKEVHLTILETHPVCTSNLSVDGLIGPNSCSIKPDTVQLSCSVRYSGNQAPDLQWTKMGENKTINSSMCSDSGNVYTCYLTMETELRMEGNSYTCQTTQSRTNQYNCTSGVFRILYVSLFGGLKELTRTVDEQVNCSVNSSSQSCNLSWIFDNGTTNWTESLEPAIELKRQGRFICQANCIIRNENCTLTVMTVNVSAKASRQESGLREEDSTPTKIIIGIVVGVAATVVLGIIFFSQRRRAHDSDEEELQNLRIDKHIGGNNILRTIKSKKAQNRGKRVKGLTILNDQLFVAFEMSAVIEVFNSYSKAARSAMVKDLIDPGAMAACAKNNCLYIMDKAKDDGKQIIRFKPSGAVIWAWATDDDDKGRISVNHDGNVVMTVYDKHMLKIYSPDGQLMAERTIDFKCIPTPSSPIDFIFHAINLDDGSFILSHGIYKSKVHRVCKVDAKGNLLLSFGSEKGSDASHLSSPAYLGKRNDGSILVADQKNHRIILLNSDLTFNSVLFTNKKDKVSFPTSMYVYENTESSLSSLYLGCNKTRNSGGCVLVLKLGQ